MSKFSSQHLPLRKQELKLFLAMSRPKTGDKRTAILDAAAEMIAREGIGASTASIARAAGVAEGSLFRYFPDKDTLLNELYCEIKREMRGAMASSFPAGTPLQKRLQHIWDSYVDWGLDRPLKRRAMLQLTVSERITEKSRAEGQVGFGGLTEAMLELMALGRLNGLPQSFASDLLLAMAETTIGAIAASPVDAARYRTIGFEGFWSASGGKEVARGNTSGN
jgi:AcrR family transcriptional regulator